MLPRTSPTKATSGVAIVSASRQSPLEGERPTTGSDEGNSSKGIACTEQPITRAHENWGSSPWSPPIWLGVKKGVLRARLFGRG
jgi:hypothetical protein